MTIDATFTHFPSLTTSRLQLRPIQPGDAEVLFALFSDEETMQFYGHEPHRSVDETRHSIEQTQARYTRREAIRWGITLKDEDQVIGSCSLHHFDPGFHRAETGYELHRVYWGQGIMTEAMSAILTYGFVDLGLLGLGKTKFLQEWVKASEKILVTKIHSPFTKKDFSSILHPEGMGFLSADIGEKTRSLWSMEKDAGQHCEVSFTTNIQGRTTRAARRSSLSSPACTAHRSGWP